MASEQSEFSKLPKKQLFLIAKKLIDEDFPTDNPYNDYQESYNTLENIAKYLISMGKQPPQTLIEEIENEKKIEIQKETYNNFNNSITNADTNAHTNQTIQHNYYNKSFKSQYNNQVYTPNSKNNHLSKIPTQMANPQQYYSQPPPPPNKYSPHYAAYVGAPVKAQPSARIKLGGAY